MKIQIISRQPENILDFARTQTQVLYMDSQSFNHFTNYFLKPKHFTAVHY